MKKSEKLPEVVEDERSGERFRELGKKILAAKPAGSVAGKKPADNLNVKPEKSGDGR